MVINARDPFLDRDAHVGLSCRVYRTDEGLAGAPTVGRLVAALHAAAAEERAAAGPTGSGQPAARTA